METHFMFDTLDFSNGIPDREVALRVALGFAESDRSGTFEADFETATPIGYREDITVPGRVRPVFGTLTLEGTWERTRAGFCVDVHPSVGRSVFVSHGDVNRLRQQLQTTQG